MTTFDSRINPHSDAFAANRAHMLRMLSEVRSLEQRTRDRSAQSRALFDKRAQLLPRDRIALLLDPGSAWLELSALAGYTLDNPDRTKAIAGAGVITGLGVVGGTRCMVVASDAGDGDAARVDAGEVPGEEPQREVVGSDGPGPC